MMLKINPEKKLAIMSAKLKSLGPRIADALARCEARYGGK
jgi:hypothetical protein